jgi:hypothetical protein
MATNTKPTRIRFNRFDGMPLPPRSILATRPGRWGNPYRWMDLINVYNCTAAEAKQKAVDAHRRWLMDANNTDFPVLKQWVLANLWRIREAEFVACSCKLDETCHVDTLIELAMANI